MYFGVIIGRQGNRKLFDEKVQAATEEAEQQAKQQQKELAVELHGELSKIRNSIVESAQAYQSVVKAVGEKLVPLEDMAEVLGADKKTQLPLFADEVTPSEANAREVEEISVDAAAIEDDVSDTLRSSTSIDAELIKEDAADSEPDTLEIDALKPSEDQPAEQDGKQTVSSAG